MRNKYKPDDQVTVKESGLRGQVTFVSTDQAVIAVRHNNGSAEYLNGELEPYHA